MIEVSDRIQITLGNAWGQLNYADGAAWRYTRVDGVTKVWRYDGKRWRRIRCIPERVRRGVGLLP
jgi:hypothetical protein